MTDPICPSCGKPILAGQARYAVRQPEHWECHEAHLNQLEADLNEIVPGLTKRFMNILRGRRS